jgi:hypothetical protein
MLSPMSRCRCPICSGGTHEIRAKLICRQCGFSELSELSRQLARLIQRADCSETSRSSI